MITRELYSSVGVLVYEHQDCWRKDGIFHIRMKTPPSCHKCGNREVIHRGTFTRVVHGPRIGLDQTVLFIKAPRLKSRRCRHVSTCSGNYHEAYPACGAFSISWTASIFASRRRADRDEVGVDLAEAVKVVAAKTAGDHDVQRQKVKTRKSQRRTMHLRRNACMPKKSTGCLNQQHPEQESGPRIRLCEPDPGFPENPRGVCS